MGTQVGTHFVVMLCLSRFENTVTYGIIGSDNNYEGEHK